MEPFETNSKQSVDLARESSLTQVKIAYLNRPVSPYGDSAPKAVEEKYKNFFPELHEPIAQANMPRNPNVHYAPWK